MQTTFARLINSTASPFYLFYVPSWAAAPQPQPEVVDARVRAANAEEDARPFAPGRAGQFPRWGALLPIPA